MDWKMIGHAWAVQLLQRHIASGQVRHAYLFTGPESVGKRTLALRFAQALCCEGILEGGETCGSCRACRLMADQIHPDLHVVESGEIGTALRVGQIRELQRKLALAPYEARWRIALMLRFHEATASASNALLKTLEEPATKVVMLLTARTTDELLPTIVSRCEVLQLRCLSVDDLEAALIERGESREQAKLLAAVAAGRPGWALRMVEDPGWLQRRMQRLDELTALLTMNRAERFQRVEKHAKASGSLYPMLETWLAFWRDATHTHLGTDTSMNNPDRKEELMRISSRMGIQELLTALRATERTLEALDRNANPQLALEALMLDLPWL
ncbi:MAG: DNA polymerase III subunit delta' [Anaerolineales bacterium]|jgi:DNA polymerase-3 subunit delta'